MSSEGKPEESFDECPNDSRGTDELTKWWR